MLNRVDALADRAEVDLAASPDDGVVSSLVPLPELLSEIAGVGPASRTVARRYRQLTGALGAELPILETTPLEDIARADSPLLAESIARLRTGRVIRDPGYDGAYGAIRMFERGELPKPGKRP